MGTCFWPLVIIRKGPLSFYDSTEEAIGNNYLLRCKQIDIQFAKGRSYFLDALGPADHESLYGSFRVGLIVKTEISLVNVSTQMGVLILRHS